ncbi:bifunctional DNA primase/polymerase [Streptomyces sp. NPDC005955]|uniref:bifunctional DNA primase/polymerase n=1 Tax=Streptomyces sp. NPDC005955 TaxID=3364738 RepID=UPI0036C8EDB3
MTQPTPRPRPPVRVPRLLTIALDLAGRRVPVLPLRAGKLPVGNCVDCGALACGGRPNMLTPGPCGCLRPCHGWAAATTNPTVLASPAWASAWQSAAGVAYHPGGAGLTVVDLDDDEAIAWARRALPPTRTVPTTRGEHWIYRGAMPSSNGVRPGVDVKSLMAYARWLGTGTGTVAPLPNTVRALLDRAETARARTAGVSPVAVRPSVVVPSGRAGGSGCRHLSPVYLERGIAMAERRITDAPGAVHHTVYRVFLAVLSTHGRCGCLTTAHVERLFAAAHAKGESPRHCAVAWANARTALGM